MARPRAHFSSLEVLESRVLLSTTVFTWTGQAGDNLWSDGGNWSTGTVPNSAYDQVVFTAGTSDWVDVDDNYTIGSLIVQGGSDIDLDFDADGHTLAVSQNDDHTGGYIDLDQTAGNQTALMISNDGAGGGAAHDTVHADSLEITGDSSGSSGLIINQDLTLALNGDLNAGQNQVTLTDSGTLTAGNAYFNGEVLPAPGVGAAVSELTVGGKFDLGATGKLRIGGTGDVRLTDTGTVSTGYLYIPSMAIVDVKTGGHFSITVDLDMGDPHGAFTAAPGLTGRTGPRLTVEDSSTVTVGDWLNLNGGNAGFVHVFSGGSVTIWALDAGAGDAGCAAPTLKISGTGSKLIATNRAIVATAAAGDAPKVEVHSAGQFIVDTDRGSGRLDIGAGSAQAKDQLLIDTGGYATAQIANFGSAASALGSYVKVTVTGDGSKLEVFDTTTLGDGLIVHGAVLTVNGGATAALGADFYKVVGADVYAGRILYGTVHALGTHADFIPGDAITAQPGCDFYYNPCSSAATGTLSIDGDLDASAGMTLDTVLDPSTVASNFMHVTGTATIAGTVNFYLAANQFDSEFAAGQSYTILTADGGLTGTFSNLAAGVQPAPSTDGTTTPLLPILPVGLRWLATYSSTSLVLSVIAIAPATNLAATTAALSPDTAYLGTRSVTITWTNNDPGIVATYIEVQEGGLSNSGDEGNFFTIGSVTGNTSTFTYNPSPHDADGFQAGATYAVRLRTLTSAGAAYSSVYTYTVPALTVDTSGLSLSYTAEDGDPSAFSILLDGQDTSASDELMSRWSGGPFADRWAAVGYPSGITMPGDPDLGTADSNGTGSLRTFAASAGADSFLLAQQGSSAITAINPGTPPHSFTLATPSLTATYTSTGMNLSWGAVTGAYGYYVVDVGNYSTTATYQYVDTTSLLIGNFATSKFTRGGYYAVIAVGYDEDYNYMWSGVSNFVDDAKAAAPSMLMTTVSDKAIKITWDNAAYNEEGYVVERSVDGGAFAAVGIPEGEHVTVGADVGEYTDTNVLLGHSYQYKVYAYRGSTNSSLNSAESGASATAKPAPPFAAVVGPPVVNDGSVQRSMVTSLTVVFNQPVTLGDGAITLVQEASGGGDPVVMPIAVNNPSGDGQTWVITFTDGMYEGGSLPDGRYDLTVDAGAVTSTLTGQAGVGEVTATFYRLFGDGDANGTVDNTDFQMLLAEYGSGNPTFDWNGNGVVDYPDYMAMTVNYGKSI